MIARRPPSSVLKKGKRTLGLFVWPTKTVTNTQTTEEHNNGEAYTQSKNMECQQESDAESKGQRPPMACTSSVADGTRSLGALLYSGDLRVFRLKCAILMHSCRDSKTPCWLRRPRFHRWRVGTGSSSHSRMNTASTKCRSKSER